MAKWDGKNKNNQHLFALILQDMRGNERNWEEMLLFLITACKTCIACIRHIRYFEYSVSIEKDLKRANIKKKRK